jgi:hypothetical protein
MTRTAAARKRPVLAEAMAAAVLTAPKLAKGETYVGAIAGPDGTGHHVILLAGDKDMITWSGRDGVGQGDRRRPARSRRAGAALRAPQEALPGARVLVEHAVRRRALGLVPGLQQTAARTTTNKDSKLRARAVRRAPL